MEVLDKQKFRIFGRNQDPILSNTDIRSTVHVLSSGMFLLLIAETEMIRRYDFSSAKVL
jgi:hypothetical protein